MTQILANPPENAPLLIRGLAMFNHHERDDLTKDPTKKRTPAVLSRMRSAADALSQFVRCTIDWIECAGHPKTATFALASSHGMEPTDAATALAKTLVRDVVPHCLASLEHGNDFFAPFANAYLHMLCDIASSYVVRGVLDDAQRLGLSDLCMRHLLPRPVKTERSMDLDDPLSNFGSSSSNSVVGQSARIAALSTLFSRLLLIHPRPLLVDVRRLFEFFVTFFGRRLSGPALPPDMVGALNFVLLRTVNSASEVILPYVTQLMPFMASHLVSSEIERLRREILVFFRIAFFVSLGESLDTDRTKDAVNSLGECVRIGWRHLMQSMERGNPSAFTPLDSSEWTLGWPTPSSDLGASTTPHPTAPFSPLFAGTLNLGVAASFSEKSRPLSSWNGLWVAAELFVRQRQLEGAAVSEHPLEAPGEIEPPSATRRRRLTTLEELLHVLSIHKRDKEDVTQVLTCQVLTFVTLRYPTAWSDFEIAQIMLALTEVLNTTNHPDVLHWACIAVATFFELPAPPAGSADPLNHSPVARISDIVLRRMSKPFCNPIFHLLLAIRIHAQRLNLQDASVVTVDPKSAFSGDTAPQPAVLRYAIYLAATDAGVWASLEWRDDALVWLFRDPQSWAAAVSADPQAVSAFLQMLAGSFGSALQLAARTHTAPLFPTDATIAEHELLGFTVAGTILFDGELPRPFTPVDAAPRLAALAREAFIHVAMCEKVLEQLQTVTAALAADATASVSLASPVAVSTLRIAADFLQFSIEQQIFEPARLELHPTFLATKDLAAACANLLPAALPEKDTQQQALFAHLKALLWVFGLTSVRFPRYFGIHLSATNIEFDTGAIATNVLYSSSINASLVDMMTKVQGYVAHMSPGKYFVLSAAQGRGATAAMDHEFQVAATQSRTRPTSLLAASFHTCSDRVTRPKQLIGHAAALLVLTYLTAGKRSVLFPYADEKKLGLVVLALAVQLVGAPTPLLDLVIDYITSSPELLTPHLANWLFWEAWELLQVTKRDSVLGAECVSLVRPTIPLIAANEDHQNIVEYSADLGDFISFFLDRCVRTFVDHHFKTVVIKFVVAALQHRISIASTEQTKFLTCLRALANDKLASVQLDLIQLLPTILGVATTFADLTMVLDSVRPMLPQQPSSEPDAMDTSHPQVSFEAYVVPILFHTQLVISLQYHRAESIADLYHVLGECEHACDPHVVMNTIATSTGFTLSEFLDLHIPSVLFTLVERGGDVITKHPSLEALTFEPYERYLVKYAGAILTAQLFCLKFDDAAQLATALNTTLPTLIAKHFVLIFSGILPKHFVHDMAAQDVAAFIKEQLTEATFHQLYQRYKDEIAKVVILRTRDNIFSPQLLFGGAAATDLDTTDIRATYTKMLQDLPPPTPCYFSRDLPEHSTTLCIQALHHIASGFETDLAHVVTAPIALSTLAMVFHRLRSSAKDVHEHAHWVHILRLVVALMSPSTRRQPFLFRFMVNSLVQTMAASPEQHALALVLNIICVEQTSFSHSPFLLGHAIPAICTILTAATTQPKVQTILSGLVGSLLSAHESYELTDLRHLPPFQDHELLRPFTAIRDALLARWRLRERPRDLIHYMNLMPDNYAIRKQLSERVRVQVSAIDALDLATAVLSRPRLTPEDVDMIGAIYPALLAIPTNSTKSPLGFVAHAHWSPWFPRPCL
ncbi:hypothetical protein BC828DRAFT_156105 [Blastocladiella britannica]|nr:hypothetical protein BC828DRAFT_156105 [Blastocladiella britannica]